MFCIISKHGLVKKKTDDIYPITHSILASKLKEGNHDI